MCVDIVFWWWCIAKNSGKIRNWGRWSDAVDVTLPDIDFVVWLRLQNMLSIWVDEEAILVGKTTWGDRKLEDNASRKLLTSSDDSYLSRSILKLPNKNICLEDSFESLCNKGEI